VRCIALAAIAAVLALLVLALVLDMRPRQVALAGRYATRRVT
jgi:hypothetical protein